MNRNAKVKVVANTYFENMESLLIEQDYIKATPQLNLKVGNNIVDKCIWIDIVTRLYLLLDEYIVFADVRHLYPVGQIDFFPIEKNHRFFYKENKNIYLFTINSIEEIKNLTEQYCEDFSLNYFFFKKTKELNHYEKYFDFLNKSESEFIELILDTDLYITFGANAEYLGLTYKKDLLKNQIDSIIKDNKNIVRE